MEVADQWRRQWVGTAEYGKVTEGGVTRRIARAMEVLHASAPGARVRVMRAAYHSSAGPGLPASSYMMHSSRRVISSGYNASEPLSLPSKPLEVSSVPLESSPEVDNEKLNYKVTEPDDTEISEPSKWRSATGSLRMPSEESSSADNASIIDLDSRNSSRNTFNRYCRDSESSLDNIKNIHIRNTRISPLLDAPVSLSTLKYTSLLNGSDEWNNRRKSYSFEDTSDLNDRPGFRNTESLVMDSSTDSGICKSNELVTENISNYLGNTRLRSKEILSDLPEETFQDWLHKNRASPTLKHSRITPSPQKECKRDDGNIISLQSKGKVTITLPVTIENDDSNHSSSTINTDDNDRKPKKVGFCKTELHFAAESGTVNIIATDEKPPPSTDFRKKKSVFVPYTSKIDKSITLFGEKNNYSDFKLDDMDSHELTDIDENTAATKGILKNRIPKPKPYLLGENMSLGSSSIDCKSNDSTIPTAVTLINRQLELEKKDSVYYNNKTFKNGEEYVTFKQNLGTTREGPQKQIKSLYEKEYPENAENYLRSNKESEVMSTRQKFTPTVTKLTTRQLRESDLTYFGVDANKKVPKIQSLDNLQEEILHSVQLVQKISNSVCNSEAESDDSHDYQNISSIKYHNVPTPKPRTKYIELTDTKSNAKVLKTISEGDNDISYSNRKSRLKSTDAITHTNRSISAPPRKETQHLRNKLHETSPKRHRVVSRESSLKEDRNQHRNKIKSANTKPNELIYANVSPKTELTTKRKDENREKLKSIDKKVAAVKHTETFENKSRSDYQKPKRTEKLTTPDLSSTPTKDSVTKRKSRLSSSNSSELTPNKEVKMKKIYENKIYIPDSITNKTDGNTKTDLSKVSNSTKRPKAYLMSNEATSKTNKEGLRDHSPMKFKEKDTIRSSSKTRSKYVINYDDKNGTVSSIRKVIPHSDVLQRKETQNRKPSNNHKIKDKIPNKSGFRK